MAVIESAENDVIGVDFVDTPEALSAIHGPGCAAAILRREPLPGLGSWIDTLAPEQLPKARVILQPDAVRKSVVEICDEAGTPDCAERDGLIDDVTALSALFAGLMDAPYLRLRLDVVTTNSCRKFHCDFVTVRLICTYRGTGTQYGIAAEGAEPSQIFTVPTGSPILLRGRLWPESPSSGLRHRSPPIEGTGETRLLLALDPIRDPDEEREADVIQVPQVTV